MILLMIVASVIQPQVLIFILFTSIGIKFCIILLTNSVDINSQSQSKKDGTKLKLKALVALIIVKIDYFTIVTKIYTTITNKNILDLL